MSAGVPLRKVLGWTLRRTTAQLFSRNGFGICHHAPQLVCCRLISSPNQRTLQSLHNNRELSQLPGQPPVTELSLQSLIDMGFTDTQAEQLNETVSNARGPNAAEHALTALSALLLLGLNSETVLKVLEKCPELYRLKDSHFQQRIANLRKLGLVEGSLQRVVSYYPQILTLSAKRVKYMVAFLREKCLFTGEQATSILRDSPSVVNEDLGQLEYKFQYVYFRMGEKQKEMVKAKLFRFSLEEVRCRHSFLERRGLYQTPDKKGQTLVLNPKLSDILAVDQDTYLKDVAKATAEEYDVFSKLMVREWQEEEQQEMDMEASDDEDEDEDEDEDDEDEEEGGEGEGRSGYMRKRKR